MPLIAVRSFVGLPISFTLLCSNRSHGTQWSRLCRRWIQFDPTSDAEFVDQLLEISDPNSAEVLLPISTQGFQMMARNREALGAHLILPPVASIENLETASDKWKLYQVCRENELPVLDSIPLRNVNPDDGSLSFPMLIKSKAREGGNGFRKVESPDQLRSVRKRIPDHECDDFFAQRFVDGVDVSVSVFCEGGEIKAHTIWKAILYEKDGYRMPQCVRFVENPKALEIARKLMKALDWEGLCDIDLFEDRQTGELWILEINARYWGTVVACRLAGVNFSELMVRRALGEGIENWPQQRQELYCHPKAFFRALALPGLRWKLLRRPFVSTGLDVTLRDPGPVWYRILARTRYETVRFFKSLFPRKAGPERSPALFSRRHMVGVGFIGLQLISIAYSRFIPERFFCWAPYDEHTFFRVEVRVGGEKLSAESVTERYRYPAVAWEPRDIDNIISQVSQYEETYGADDDAQVTITYKTNTHPQQTWTWPEK